MRFWQALSYEPTENLVPLARTCEELGFEGVCLADHVVGPRHPKSSYPYDYNDGKADFVAEVEHPEPFTAIAAMATATERLRFNTLIFIAPLRHPVLLAKSVSTAAVLSQGRTVLGAGVGWLEDEFDAVDQPFAQRGRRLDEMVDVMRKLWTGDFVEHHGEFYDFDELRMIPAPPGRIPIHFGGLHPRVLERTGRLGDGWLSPGNTPAEFPRYRDAIEDARARANRSDAPFEYIMAAPDPGDLDAYRAMDDPRIAIIQYPLTFQLGPDASLQERQDALARNAEALGIGT